MFDMFQNRKIKGVHISRYCASWIKAGGQRFDHYFIEWLKGLKIDGEHLTFNEICDIRNYAQNGRLELETSARNFFKTKGL